MNGGKKIGIGVGIGIAIGCGVSLLLCLGTILCAFLVPGSRLPSSEAPSVTKEVQLEEPTEVPSATPTLVPTSTPTPTVASFPTSSPTPTPTSTPIPTAMPTSTPTLEPIPTPPTVAAMPAWLCCADCAEVGMPINLWSWNGHERVKVVDKLPHGTQVLVLESERGDDGRLYYHVVREEHEGWVSEPFICWSAPE